MTEHIGDLIMTIKHIWELNHSQKRELIKVLNEIKQYRALGTVEELKESREKQIAKEVNLIGKNVSIGTKIGSCPNCDGRPLRECDCKYCPDCGQKLDWSEI